MGTTIEHQAALARIEEMRRRADARRLPEVRRGKAARPGRERSPR